MKYNWDLPFSGATFLEKYGTMGVQIRQSVKAHRIIGAF